MSSERKSPLQRRHFLRGLGAVAVGLPFLESVRARHAGAESTPLKRFAVFHCCNGVNMQKWFPTGDFGALSEASFANTSNASLAPFAKKVTFPRGIHMSPRGWGMDGGEADDHGKGMAHKLTAQFTNEDWLAMGESVDHLLARNINPGEQGARRAPLNLHVGRLSEYKGLDYISYRGPADAVAGIDNPWNAYADFMNLGGTPNAPSEASDRVLRRRQSVLDLVGEQFAELKRAPLSRADKDKLDAHFTAIRGLETNMGQMESLIGCGDADLAGRAGRYEGQAKLVEDEAEYPTLAELHVDIMALALACDANRVATVQFGGGAGGPTFRWAGMNHEYNHHKLSHGKVRDDCFGDSTEDGCSDVAGYEQMLADIDTWHQTQFARLLSKLDGYVEADGKTVLDNSVVLYANELSDGKAHSWMNLPFILAGGGAGALRMGEHILLGEGGDYDPEKAPHNRFLNTLINVMGVESAWFGAPEGSGGQTMQGGVYEELLS
jgi:hypothetical protein